MCIAENAAAASIASGPEVAVVAWEAFWRSTGAPRRAAREHLSLSFPGPAPIERGRAPARRHSPLGRREASPEFPRRLSKGPTHFRRAEVRTKRDSSSGALCERWNGPEDRRMIVSNTHGSVRFVLTVSRSGERSRRLRSWSATELTQPMQRRWSCGVD